MNLGQYSFKGIRNYLAGIWYTRSIFFLYLCVSTVTVRRCYRALFVSLIVYNSGGFWPLLISDTKRNERDLLCIWIFFTVLGCLCKALLLTDRIQKSIPMAMFILVIKPKIQFKRRSRVHSSTKSIFHMLSIGIFE